MQFRRPNLKYLEGDAIRPSNVQKAAVEDFAAKVAFAYKFPIGASPTELVERMGGRIHLQHLEEWIDESGSIFVHGEWDFDVLLPYYTSPRRDRFTVAHELGHYFLHSAQGDMPIIAYRKGSTRIEWEANWFAAALLMPAEPFREAVKLSKDITAVAEKFGVSEDAARVRKESLGA